MKKEESGRLGKETYFMYIYIKVKFCLNFWLWLSLHCCARIFLAAASRGYFLVVVRELQVAVASLWF